MKKEKDKSSFLFEDLPFFNLLYSVVGLVCSAPVNHLFGRLSTISTFIGEAFLMEWHTSAGNAHLCGGLQFSVPLFMKHECFF